MIIVDKGEGTGPGPPAEAPTNGEVVIAPDGDDIVRLGDMHASGVESLCIGESQ